MLLVINLDNFETQFEAKLDTYAIDFKPFDTYFFDR
jgi:hypothetical protein